MLEKIGTWLQGKKTYIVMVGAFVIAGLMANGIVIPDYVWGILAALGLGAIRSAIEKLKQ